MDQMIMRGLHVEDEGQFLIALFFLLLCFLLGDSRRVAHTKSRPLHVHQ
jgi:hypothetical protein